MMAVAGWLVWRRHETARRLALRWFAVQLALNVGWSAVFFGLQMPGLAFVEILALWFAIAATLTTFWRVSRPAGILLVPYLLWVSFAAALNLAIWRLNA
jgi:tryptophan-rich sensory protein